MLDEYLSWRPVSSRLDAWWRGPGGVALAA